MLMYLVIVFLSSKFLVPYTVDLGEADNFRVRIVSRIRGGRRILHLRFQA